METAAIESLGIVLGARTVYGCDPIPPRVGLDVRPPVAVRGGELSHADTHPIGPHRQSSGIASGGTFTCEHPSSHHSRTCKQCRELHCHGSWPHSPPGEQFLW